MDDINKIFSGKVAFNVKVSEKCICWSGPKAQTLTSYEIVKEQTQTPLDHKSTSCSTVKFNQVELEQSLKRRLEEPTGSSPEKPGGDLIGATRKP